MHRRLTKSSHRELVGKIRLWWSFKKCEQIIRVIGKHQSSPALQEFLASSAYEQTIPRPFCSEIPVLSVILPEHGSDYSSCFKKNYFTRRMRMRRTLLGKVTEFSMAYRKSTVACYESCTFSINKSAHLAFRSCERVDPAVSRPLQLS